MRPLAAACALLVAATGARAQSAEPDQSAQAAATDAPVATVVVTGLRRSLEDSVTAKKNSDSIIEVVSAEDLGKLPDASIAESLARLPGVTGQRGPDGRVNVISIRGLSPEFSGSLLNGREVVSSNDARAVEYDQFPSELIGSATVYKTPDATLIGQGLSGTVDLRSRRPLDTRGRQVAINLRGEKNSNGQLVPGVAPKLGSRFSVSFVDQFANNTIGIAAGFARLDVSSQVKQTQNVMYADFTPYGLPVNGNAPSQDPMADGTTGQSMLPMYWTATTSSKRNTRDGLMAVLEYKPNRDLHSQVDLYYSKFNTHEVGGIFLMNMWGTWAGGIAPNLTDVGTTQVGQNTFTTSATADKLPVTTGNFDTKRKDNIAALGWNTELRLNQQWKATTDLSWSRDTRDETYSEVYEAPFDNATQNWTYGGFKWNVPVTAGAAQTFTPLNPTLLSDPNTVKLGDAPAFDFVGDQDAYTGAVRTPHIKDELKALRVAFERSLDNSIFSNFVAGLNTTQRSKDVAKNESRLLMQKDANGNYIRDVPQAALGTPFDMSWAGIPSLIRIDVPALAQTGALSLQPLFAQMPDNNSDVREKVVTAYGMLNIDTDVGPVALRGNVGLQAVHTDQRSDGWVYRGNNANPDISKLSPLSGGATYNDYLPSLNLVGQFRNGWQARLGLAKTMARPNIVDMRAGISTPTVVPDREGPHVGEWTTTYSGNPALEPWRAKSIDLSLEKYFGARSYLSVAVFQKNLLNYVFNQQFKRDNSDVPVVNVPPGVTPQQYGALIMPVNGHGGKLKGLEVSAALEGSLVSPMLDGYGVVFSGSHLVSHLKDQDGQEVSLNGLSGKSASVTAYYEKSGFSARISQRYRSAFTATTRDIFLNATTRRQEADRTVDMQLGYEFGNGAYKGLSILLQVDNLTDKPTVSSVNAGNNAPDTSMMLPQYTYYFGRQVLLGANYKF